MKKTHDGKVKMLIGSGKHAIPVVVPKGKKVMIGAGEHAIFVRTGETSKEYKDRQEKKLCKICREAEREQNLEKIKRKALTLFKKRG